ncbi:MAG: class IV adenylate cyclase [Promethearchaeota archaeon]
MVSNERELEIEIKVKIDTIGSMAVKVKNLGSKFCCDVIHEDVYFDMPPALGTFMETDEALRVRISHNITEGTSKAHVTYKGRKLDQETKTREEIDAVVLDGQNMRNIFKRLGYREVMVVKKKRKIFTRDEITITLDEVEYLPDPYMELEIMAGEGELENKRALLYDFLVALGCSRAASERRSYLELIFEQLEAARRN